MATGINVKFLSINSEAFDVSALTLGLGQEIIMSIPSLEGDVRWFADNDPALKITPNGNLANMIAEQVGQSTILIMDEATTILREIVITVISEEAVNLGLKASSPEPKQ